MVNLINKNVQFYSDFTELKIYSSFLHVNEKILKFLSQRAFSRILDLWANPTDFEGSNDPCTYLQHSIGDTLKSSLSVNFQLRLIKIFCPKR